VSAIAPIVEVIGGWRATAFLAIAIGMAVVAGGWRLKAERLEAAVTAHANADLQMQLWAMGNARDIEYQHRLALGEITGRLAQENRDAREHFQGMLAAARSGAARLRDDRKCPAAPAEAGTAAAGSDAAQGAYLPAEAVERVLRIGHEADDVARELKAAQASALACHAAVAKWNEAQSKR
jgi:hypothetical protein